MPINHRKIANAIGIILVSILVPLALTLFDWPMRLALKPSNILLVYLLGVFFLALKFGQLASFIASITSAIAFAYFFAPPIFSLGIADQENLIGLTVMLIVGAITSQQAEDVRTQSQLANHREKRASALYRLSKALAEAPLETQIIEISVRHIHAVFNTRNLIILPNQHGELAYPKCAALDISYRTCNLILANRLYRHAADPTSPENITHDESAIFLPLTGYAGPIGMLVVEQLDNNRIQLPEQRQLLDTFANQIVHTLERAHLAEQAKQATLKIQAEALRNSLLSSISHDLRTPLATIIGAASTLETDQDRLSDATRQSLVKAINAEAYRMSDLTSKILQMARLEAGEVILNRQWYEAEEIIGSALHRLEHKLKDRPIHVKIPDSQALIHVDAVLLQQVLINLLENADKYSPTGLAIDITLETQALALSIAITDHGFGIPVEFQDRIFDKFFQIHAESAQSGVGLGLSICRAIVEAHGGKIFAQNRSGGGAVFQVDLPFQEQPPTIATEDLRLNA